MLECFSGCCRSKHSSASKYMTENTNSFENTKQNRISKYFSGPFKKKSKKARRKPQKESFTSQNAPIQASGGIRELPNQRPRLDPKDFQIIGCKGEVKVKASGTIKGQAFMIDDCEDCDIFLVDHCAQVTVDNCRRCRLFIGPTEASVFLRDCTDCDVVVLCRQLRTRDCHRCQISLLCRTRPIIESSTSITISCYDLNYKHFAAHMAGAKLSALTNFWSFVYDFTPHPGNFQLTSGAALAKDRLRARQRQAIMRGDGKGGGSDCMSTNNGNSMSTNNRGQGDSMQGGSLALLTHPLPPEAAEALHVIWGPFDGCSLDEMREGGGEGGEGEDGSDGGREGRGSERKNGSILHGDLDNDDDDDDDDDEDGHGDKEKGESRGEKGNKEKGEGDGSKEINSLDPTKSISPKAPKKTPKTKAISAKPADFSSQSPNTAVAAAIVRAFPVVSWFDLPLPVAGGGSGGGGGGGGNYIFAFWCVPDAENRLFAFLRDLETGAAGKDVATAVIRTNAARLTSTAARGLASVDDWRGASLRRTVEDAVQHNRTCAAVEMLLFSRIGAYSAFPSVHRTGSNGREGGGGSTSVSSSPPPSVGSSSRIGSRNLFLLVSEIVAQNGGAANGNANVASFFRDLGVEETGGV